MAKKKNEHSFDLINYNIHTALKLLRDDIAGLMKYWRIEPGDYDSGWNDGVSAAMGIIEDMIGDEDD